MSHLATASDRFRENRRAKGRLNRSARRALSAREPRGAAIRLAKSVTAKLDEFNRAIEEQLFSQLERFVTRKDAVPDFIQCRLDILRLRLQTIFRDTARI